MKASPNSFGPLLILFGMVAGAFLLAWGIVAVSWPDAAAWIIILDVATIIIFPAGYWLIKQTIAKNGKWPYFIFQFDLILPVVPYFLVVLALIAPLPQFATFAWGETTIGIVQGLQTELRPDIDRGYRVTTAYFSEAGGQWTKDIYIGRKLFNTLAIDDSVTLHYFPQLPNRAIIADPFLMQTQAWLLLWSIFALSGWLMGVFVNNHLHTHL